MNWTDWKRFPSPHHGPINAPTKPGLYEVCHTGTGEVVAFGVSGNLAQALVNAVRPPLGRIWPFFFCGAPQLDHPIEELEFRTCSTATIGEARRAAQHIESYRPTIWQRLALVPR